MSGYDNNFNNFREVGILEFSARLHKLRTNKGLSLTQVAKDTGLSLASISSYESGRRYPSKKVGAKLVEYFGIEWDDLFGNKY